jgi:hypothetical protein
MILVGQGILDMTSKAQASKTEIHKWDYINLKIFCTTKKPINRVKRQPTEWEKIFAKYAYDKWVRYRTYQEFKEFNTTKIRLKDRQKIEIDISQKYTCSGFGVSSL